jgi:hypothetical protein
VKKSSRVLVFSLVALVVLGCLGSAVASAFLCGAVADFGGDGVWKVDGIPQSRWKNAFGVTMPVTPVKSIGRELGFQDPYSEVVIHLPPGSAPAFLAANALTRGPGGRSDPGIITEIGALAPGTPKLEGFELELPPHALGDGGYSGLFRQGTLYEGPGGETFLHLVVFGT